MSQSLRNYNLLIAQLGHCFGPLVWHATEGDTSLLCFSCSQADSEAVVRIVQGILQPESQAELYAILEEPIPNPTNGLLSVLGTGYAYGIWKGVLASHAIRVESTSARRWKGDLGLNKLGKEGSRALALTLFPKARDLLK